MEGAGAPVGDPEGGWPRRWRGEALRHGLTLLLAAHAWRLKAGIDLEVYLRAGARALAGEPLYRLSEASPFKYAPPAALLLAPWSLLPHGVAHGLWLALSATAFSALAGLECRRRGLPGPWPPLLVLGLSLPALAQVLFLGQVDALLALAMAVSELEAARRPLRSGLLWALACAFKLPFLLFAVVAVAFGERRRLLGLGLGALGLLGLGLVRWGPAGLAAETLAWQGLLADSTAPVLRVADNQSLAAALATLGLEGWTLVAATAGLGLGLLGGTAAAVRRERGARPDGARRLAGALAFALTVLLSPLGWLSNLVVLAPLSAELLARRRWPAARALATGGLVALAATLPVSFELLGRAHYRQLLELRPFGLAALAATACLALTAWRAAPATPT